MAVLYLWRFYIWNAINFPLYSKQAQRWKFLLMKSIDKAHELCTALCLNWKRALPQWIHPNYKIPIITTGLQYITLYTKKPVTNTSDTYLRRSIFSLTGFAVFLLMLMPQNPDIFFLADAAWKHPKYPCFCILPLEFGVDIDIHKHENSEGLCSNRNNYPKGMSGISKWQKHGKHVNRFHLTKCTG